MQRILKYIISENTTPVTILDFLKKEGFSRHILSSMKNTPNTIILNGERGFGRSVLKPQDHLIITCDKQACRYACAPFCGKL